MYQVLLFVWEIRCHSQCCRSWYFHKQTKNCSLLLQACYFYTWPLWHKPSGIRSIYDKMWGANGLQSVDTSLDLILEHVNCLLHINYTDFSSFLVVYKTPPARFQKWRPVFTQLSGRVVSHRQCSLITSHSRMAIVPMIKLTPFESRCVFVNGMSEYDR